MRIKKVNSKSIFLHEDTKVKFKTVGDTREVQFSAGVNRRCPIQNISKKNTLIEKQEKSKRERNRRTVT